MPTITVTWDSTNNRPTAAAKTVTGTTSQTITWQPAAGVTITNISTPKLSGKNDFTAPAAVPGTNNWSCTDNMNDDGTFNYRITGTNTATGFTATHDPQITNDRDG
ncbi:MAG: hypothetical protein AAF657_06540 [Acidobacteriota bacterium]